jgi:hypothetical protein
LDEIDSGRSHVLTRSTTPTDCTRRRK